jgi:hypothetical protein
MGIIQASIPLFFILIAAELLFTRLGRRSFYRLNDSISDDYLERYAAGLAAAAPAVP